MGGGQNGEKSYNEPIPPKEKDPAVPPPAREGEKPLDNTHRWGPLRKTGAPLLSIPEPKVLGMDVSHYQPKVNWDAVKRHGFKFCFAKASDGTSPTAMHDTHRENAIKHGLLFGSYHFFRFAKDPEAQVDTFLRATGGIRAGELPHVGDFEWDKQHPNYGEGKTMDDRAADLAYRFMELLEKKSGMTPFLYSSYPFFKGFKNPERFFRFHPWCPAYGGVAGPKVPLPWSKVAVHQWTDKHAAAKELTGDPHFDANYYNGTLEQLRAMTKGYEVTNILDAHRSLGVSEETIEKFKKQHGIPEVQ